MNDFAIRNIDRIIIDSSYIKNSITYKKQYMVDYMNRVVLYEEENSLFLKIEMEICNEDMFSFFIQELKNIIDQNNHKLSDKITIYYNITKSSGEEEMKSICFKGCKFAKKEILYFDLTKITNFDLVYKITNSDISYI